MEVIYAIQEAEKYDKPSVFMAGPTPRVDLLDSEWQWRRKALKFMKLCDVQVFVPEPEDGKWNWTAEEQIEWELKHLETATVVMIWLPRIIEPDKPGIGMPAFTTNTEFGLYVKSGKLVYGRPHWAKKCGYHDHLYKKYCGEEPLQRLSDTALVSAERAEENYVRV